MTVTENTREKTRKHRTKLKDRGLPDYTRGEEIFNMVSHIVGGAMGIAILVLCIIMAALRGNALGVITSCIYGVSMIALYCMSSIYHGLRPGTAKKVFQIIDHCTIFVLIAGSYTPITLVAIRPLHPAIGWTMFGVVWALAVIGIIFNAIDLEMYKVFSMICYIGMGWCVMLFFPQTLEALTKNGVILLVIGGVIYTIGAVLYGIGARKRYIHSIFHLFVLGGSIFHFFAILFYALPTR
jgi:hemolysin III